MKFLITYRSGKTEEVVTDATTVEDQINRTFGLNSVADADDFGVHVEIVLSDEELAERQRIADEAAEQKRIADEAEAERLKRIADEAEAPPAEDQPAN